MKYTLSEEFLSFQGEGSYMGKRAYFIRLYGCPIKCSWCDTKNSWLGESYVSSDDDILSRVLNSNAEIAVITGGEPCLQNLSDLIDALRKNNIKVHLETSGIFPNKWKFDWIVLSPKIGVKVDESFLDTADELKFILEDTSQMANFESIIENAKNIKSIWIHPQSQKNNEQKLLSDIAEYVISRGGKYRVGCQLHKIYNFR